jgi:hypothetical protein
MWSNPTICSENCRNNKKVEKRKNGDKGDKKSSQDSSNVMICLSARQVFLAVFLRRLGTSSTENRRIIILMAT